MDSSVDSPGCSSCLLRNSLTLRLEGLCHNTFLGIHSLMMSLLSEDIRIIMMQNDLHPNHHEGSFRENMIFLSDNKFQMVNVEASVGLNGWRNIVVR